MNRGNFIKTMFIGGLGVAILPNAIFVDPAKDIFFVGLFYNEEEVKYENYKRMIFRNANTTIDHNKIVFKSENQAIIFPRLRSSEIVRFDSWGIFKNKELIYLQHMGCVYSCAGGIITLMWDENVC